MDEMYKALMRGKKRAGERDDNEKDAMMRVLKDIHGMASDDMGHDIKGMKKVSVASDTVNGLKAGLDKAKGMVQNYKHRPFGNEEANDVSDDMHQDSHRSKRAMKSEVSDELPEEDDKADHMPAKGDENDDATHRYAQGGQIDEDQEEHESLADASGAEHQSLQSHGFQTDLAKAIIKKEMDTNAYAQGGSVMGTMGQGTHGTHGSPDPADEYADLEPEELEALIAHLQKFRKSKPTW